MHRLVILFFGIVIIWSCSSNKPLVQIEDTSAKSDTTEYTVIVTEPSFESWFITNRKPIWYYEENYYKQFNQLYSNEWNHRVRSIDYDIPYMLAGFSIITIMLLIIRIMINSIRTSVY